MASTTTNSKERNKEQSTNLITKKKARKAYFSKKLPQYLNEVQAQDRIEGKELEKLEKWLEEFRQEEKELIKELRNYIPIEKENIVPEVDDLFAPPTEEDKIKIDKWIKDVEDNLKDCVKLAREQRDKIMQGKPVDSKKLLDLGLFFITNEFSFNQLFAYRERLYKAKIAELIDSYSISRREAQDRAEITKEYFDYNVIKRNLDTLKELEVYAKKYKDNF